MVLTKLIEKCLKSLGCYLSVVLRGGTLPKQREACFSPTLLSFGSCGNGRFDSDKPQRKTWEL